MAIDFDNLQNPTNAQMLALAKQSLAQSMQALSLGKGDRTLTRASLDQLQRQVDYWQEKVDAETGQSNYGGVAFGEFQDPT